MRFSGISTNPAQSSVGRTPHLTHGASIGQNHRLEVADRDLKFLAGASARPYLHEARTPRTQSAPLLSARRCGVTWDGLLGAQALKPDWSRVFVANADAFAVGDQ